MGAYLLVILLLGVLGVLVVGVLLMGLGGKANTRYGNKLMVARVVLQGLVVLLLIAMYIIAK